MDELLKKLLAALGITAEGEDYASAIDAAMQKIDTLSNVSKDVAALKAQIESKESKVDLAQYVPIATYNALRENVASLKAENDQQSIDQLIDAGKKSGRVVASEVDYLKMLGAQNGVASLKAAIDGRSAIAALAATQTTDTPKDTGIAVLTADQKEACRVLGKTETEYLTFLGAK